MKGNPYEYCPVCGNWVLKDIFIRHIRRTHPAWIMEELLGEGDS